MEPLRSAKSTVTCLRSPSRAALELRIRPARCLGVGLRRGEPYSRRGLISQRLATAPTELPAGRHGDAARGARHVEFRAALLAEGNAGAIVEPALRAEH